MNEPDTPSSPEEEARRAELRARMQKGQERMREMRASGWKPVVLNPLEKARANPNSKVLAIRAHCWECCGGDGDSNVRARVRDCGLVTTCALWPHRPWQKFGMAGGAEPDDDDIAELPESDPAAVPDTAA